MKQQNFIKGNRNFIEDSRNIDIEKLPICEKLNYKQKIYNDEYLEEYFSNNSSIEMNFVKMEKKNNEDLKENLIYKYSDKNTINTLKQKMNINYKFKNQNTSKNLLIFEEKIKLFNNFITVNYLGT